MTDERYDLKNVRTTLVVRCPYCKEVHADDFEVDGEDCYTDEQCEKCLGKFKVIVSTDVCVWVGGVASPKQVRAQKKAGLESRLIVLEEIGMVGGLEASEAGGIRCCRCGASPRRLGVRAPSVGQSPGASRPSPPRASRCSSRML